MVNERAVAIYIGIFVALVIAIIILLPSHHTSISSFSTVTGQQQNSSTSQTTTVARVTTQPYSNKCDISELLPLKDGWFSKGTYADWNASGLGFGSAPLNITEANNKSDFYSQAWNVSNTTFIATNYNGGRNIVAGNLTSNNFTATLPYLNFQLVSPDNRLIYIEILKNGVPQIVDHFNTYAAPSGGNSTSRLINASVTIIPLLCSNVQVRIVDAFSGTALGEFDYVAAAGFYQSAKQETTPGILVNQSINLT